MFTEDLALLVRRGRNRRLRKASAFQMASCKVSFTPFEQLFEIKLTSLQIVQQQVADWSNSVPTVFLLFLFV